MEVPQKRGNRAKKSAEGPTMKTSSLLKLTPGRSREQISPHDPFCWNKKSAWWALKSLR